MTSNSMNLRSALARGERNGWRMAAAGLVLAAAIVALAIMIGGPAARVLNGVGAILWLASAITLALSLPDARQRLLGWLVAVASALILGAVVRPDTPVEAIASFGVAGALVVLFAGDRRGVWALLAPAIYLPVHLLIGIGRAMLRNGGLRTEPPPTAAIVPLLIVGAAAIGGVLAAAVVRRGR